ncbi:MAG: ComF family protein [Corynebacterium sp.]|nr:ComF family protein [Corynebacterium sp.]
MPVWSLGVLGGVRRHTIINVKERGRVDVIPHLGEVLRASVAYLQARGDVDMDITLVPAPTKKSAMARRGGDIVTRVCYASGLSTLPALWLTETGQDSVGLSISERWQNRLGSVRVDKTCLKNLTGHVLIIDDVITTGATLKAAIMVLTSRGVLVRGGLGWSHA